MRPADPDRSALCNAIREILIDRATTLEDACITYTELAERVNLMPRSPGLAGILDEISTEENDARRGILSALVVEKKTGLPSDGFFRLASSLGRDIADRRACWQAEVERIRESWRPQS